MKAIKLVFVAALTAVVLMLTSCMGDGSSKIDGYGYGIVKMDYSTMKPILYGASYYGPLHSSALLNYLDNEYLVVTYSFDLDDEANANYTDNGYIVANISVIASEKEDMKQASYSQATESDTPRENEVKVGGFEIFNFLDSKLLVGIGISNYTKEDFLSYKIEYNPEQEPGKNSSLNVYDFYLRTTHIPAGTGSSIGEYVVCNLKEPITKFKNQETNAGNKSFYIRFNYATNVGEDKVTWTQSGLIQVASSND